MNTILTADERNRIIDSMGWSLDAQERGDMHRLIQAVLAKLAQQADRQRVPEGWMQPRMPAKMRGPVTRTQEAYGFVNGWNACVDAMLAAAPEAPEAPAQAEVWFEDRNGASRKTPDDCARFGANGVPQAVWVKGVRYVSENEAPAQASAVDERAAFEAWYSQNAFNFERDPIGSRDCGLQWKAWQARAALAQKGGQA